MPGPESQLSLFETSLGPSLRPDFSVRESSRAKRLSIRVFPRGGVEVVVPRRTRPAEVQAFVDENRDWIAKARAEFAHEHVPEAFALPERVSLPAIGSEVQVAYRYENGAGAVRFRRVRGRVLLTGRTQDDRLCIAALKRWLGVVAKEEFAPRLRRLSASTGNAYRAMHVRGQRTCWGSHSQSGTISINYCLLFVAPELLRYLMVHELCHARHMNHSRRFWALVARHEPDYRRLDRALSDAWKQVPSWLGFY